MPYIDALLYNRLFQSAAVLSFWMSQHQKLFDYLISPGSNARSVNEVFFMAVLTPVWVTNLVLLWLQRSRPVTWRLGLTVFLPVWVVCACATAWTLKDVYTRTHALESSVQYTVVSKKEVQHRHRLSKGWFLLGSSLIIGWQLGLVFSLGIVPALAMFLKPGLLEKMAVSQYIDNLAIIWGLVFLGGFTYTIIRQGRKGNDDTAGVWCWTTTTLIGLGTSISVVVLSLVWFLCVQQLTVGTQVQEFYLVDLDVSKVLKQNLDMAKHSWEHGVLTHALLELQNPELTVFAGPGYGVHLRNPFPGAQLEPFPNGKLPRCGSSGTKLGRYDEWTKVKGLRYAASKIQTYVPIQGRRSAAGPRLFHGGEGKDTSAADTASLGWAALLLAQADALDPDNPVGHGRNAYEEAVEMMVEFLFTDTAQNGNSKFMLVEQSREGNVSIEHESALREVGSVEGKRWAISHQVDSPQLWADSVFMVPPFLAVYAVVRQDSKWLWEAVEQIKAYRDVLAVHSAVKGKNNQDYPPEEQNGRRSVEMWKHIVTTPRHLGEGVCCHDEGLWLTGNAWALAGMIRVLGVLQRWRPSMTEENLQLMPNCKITEATAALRQMTNDMLVAVRQSTLGQPGLIRNYLDGPGSEFGEWAFEDAAGTALLASSIYRLAQFDILDDLSMVQWADELYNSVAEQIDNRGVLGRVASVSEAPSKHQVTSTSEGQSFAIMMYAARRDCAKIGICQRYEEPAWWRRFS